MLAQNPHAVSSPLETITNGCSAKIVTRSRTGGSCRNVAGPVPYWHSPKPAREPALSTWRGSVITLSAGASCNMCLCDFTAYFDVPVLFGKRRMLQSLICTSRKMLSPECESTEIERIVAVSRVNNSASGITGGLINADSAFAQLLEGPAVAIEDVMRRIKIDPRHADVQVLRTCGITHRQLPDWSMAYSGSWTTWPAGWSNLSAEAQANVRGPSKNLLD